ncbi:MAG: hypothetical protein EPO24_10640 [Bacteroidetes bacterium]|nr:MAG: hypothetical protein EPO24_10640 [Bacteroidota bacterium]
METQHGTREQWFQSGKGWGTLFFMLLTVWSIPTNAQPPSWSIEPSNFQYNVNITAIFLLNDAVNEDTSNILGAFVHNEVRGVSRLMYSGGGWRYFLTVYSNALSGDTVMFQMYVARLDSILVINEQLCFFSDSLYGDPGNPELFHSSTLPEQDSLFLQLQTGWNLVALPYTMSSYEKASVFPTSSSDAFSYLNGYQPKTTLKNGEGYWLKFDADSSGEAQTILLQGYPRSKDAIRVTSGWNIVGSISESISTAHAVSQGTTITTPFYGFHSGYQQADSILPGNSYWVKVSQDGTIVLSSTTTLKQVTSQER